MALVSLSPRPALTIYITWEAGPHTTHPLSRSRLVHLLVLLSALEQEVGGELLVLVTQEERLEDHLAVEAELLELFC